MSEQNNLPEVKEEQKNEVAVNEPQMLQISSVDINNSSDIAKIQDAEPMPIELIADYWTPENTGESKRVVYVKKEVVIYPDQQTGELKGLESVFIAEPKSDSIKMYSNGSKKLVAALENIPFGTPLLITYLGKKKNKTNQYQSDNWSVKPLIIKS